MYDDLSSRAEVLHAWLTQNLNLLCSALSPLIYLGHISLMCGTWHMSVSCVTCLRKLVTMDEYYGSRLLVGQKQEKGKKKKEKRIYADISFSQHAFLTIHPAALNIRKRYKLPDAGGNFYA